MRAHRWTVTALASLAAAVAAPARAQMEIGVQLPYEEFGHLANAGASCAATATANSFRFLDNRYERIYDRRLTGDTSVAGNLAAARDRLRDGWQTGSNPARAGMGCGPSPELWWTTKIQYIEDFAPGTTKYGGQFAASYFNAAAGTTFDVTTFDRRGRIADRGPGFGFLFSELLHGEDIEFAFQGTDVDGNAVDHAMTLTSLRFTDMDGDATWDPASEAATIDYLDPNNPTQLFMSALRTRTTNVGGVAFEFLEFDWNNGGANRPAPNSFIYLAYTESAVPEPATALLVAAGVVLLAIVRRRVAV